MHPPNIPLAAKNIVRPAKEIENMLERRGKRRSNMISIPFAGFTVFVAAKGTLGVRTMFGTLRYYCHFMSLAFSVEKVCVKNYDLRRPERFRLLSKSIN